MGWGGRRVLVTGGAGFLGANLCHELAQRGARVVALDGFLFGGGANPANLTGTPVELVRGDIREIDLRNVCEGASVIFNLAAQTSHMGGQNDPLADIAVNAVAQVRLIHAAREAAPDAIVVHASTRQFYGRVQRLPVDENQPVAPPDANGVSKFAGEQYWMLEHRVKRRPVVSLRLTNCYGPRLRIRDARQTFLGIWIRCVLEGRAFEVWGGSQLRDLTYVDDVTEAFLLAADTPECHGRIFNIGGSPPASLLEIAELMVRLAGPGARFITRDFPAERATIDIGSYHADDSAFRAATGWLPRVSLEEGIARSLEWFRPRLAEYL
jgi:UDP-glucose 4-epimerase